jgi:hypothetical protein
MKRMLITSNLQRTHVRFGFCGTMIKTNTSPDQTTVLGLQLQRPWTWTERTAISVDNKERERESQRIILVPHHRINFSFESHRPSDRNRIYIRTVHFRTARTEGFFGKRESSSRRSRFRDIKSKLQYNSNPDSTKPQHHSKCHTVYSSYSTVVTTRAT